MRPARTLRLLLLTALLVGPALAGCLAPAATETPVTPAARAAAPGVGINESLLTQPLFEALPKIPEYVTVTVDGIKLYVEVYLPDGPGPWPAILIHSPYRSHGRNGDVDEEPRFREYFVPRGYAVVLGDVRGTGYSEGCQNMMGAKEQQDAYDLVEWIAAQPWSDGKVGMYGVSYVGTTPSEAAIMNPPHLVTIVPVAGVTNQWRNMYQNGVPYLFRFYPLTYELTTGATPPTNVGQGPAWAANVASGACEQEETLEHVSPGTYEKGVYDDYWHERNFTTRVKNINASVFYNQGFTDRAVNPMEAIYWFNEIEAPKKAFLGQWAHRTPDREDWQNALHAWFDYWLKGIDNGIMDTPTVEVMLNDDTVRVDTEWPPTTATPWTLYLSPGELLPEAPTEGSETYVHDPAGPGAADLLPEGLAPTLLPNGLQYVTEPLANTTHLAGSALMHMTVSVDAPNTYLLCSLYDVDGDTWTEVAEGWMNAHLWKRFDESNPLTPGEKYTMTWKFEPREYLFKEGHRIGLRIHGHDPRVFPFDEPRTENTVYYGGDAPTALELPLLHGAELHPRPKGV
ncbi:MAG TPA: CocE/NonD family hydrolase [Candidatus Thermoplasmatota archaeon]|nr:CocE/NonD family hydrolase [Candidatus Thermoplasmatota archaeon]